MKIAGKIKKGSTWLLALTLMLPGMTASTVQAAVGIDTEAVCSVSFALDGNLEEEFSELKEIPVPVKLYRVADVDSSGVYTAIEGYGELGLEEVNDQTTAAEWEEMGKKASETVKTLEASPAAETVLENGAGSASDLATGMYLVEADTVLSPEYEYKFTPYLISLPNNYYASTEDDTWVYDVTTGLKPGKENRLGSLQINKKLSSYNATLGNASFVFQVEGEKDHEVVYSNVVSLVFDGTGSKNIVISDLPAGATFTVTEIYSGASYKPTEGTAASGSAEITAEETVEVSFDNTYNGQLNGGASVVNQFTVDKEGIWDWQAQADSSAHQN